MKEKMTIGLITQLTDSGVKKTVDVLGEITETFVNVKVSAMDAAIQKKLIELGWTPPVLDRSAAVKAGAQALKQEAAWLAADLSGADAERCVEAVLNAILPPNAGTVLPARSDGQHE